MRMPLEKVTMNVSYKCLIVKTVNVWKLLNGFVLMLTLFCFYYYYSTKVHLYIMVNSKLVQNPWKISSILKSKT